MTAKRLLITAVLAILVGTTGCRSWCENHYPCQQGVAAAPPPGGCCCCPPGTTALAPVAAVPPPAPPPPQNWGAPAAVPAGGTACTPCR
jgi:hypothetical protein